MQYCSKQCLLCFPFFNFHFGSNLFLAVWCPAWLMTEAQQTNPRDGWLWGCPTIWYRAQRCMFTFITNTLSSSTNNTITTQARRLGQLTKAFCQSHNPNLVSSWRSWGRVSSIRRGTLLSVFDLIFPKLYWPVETFATLWLGKWFLVPDKERKYWVWSFCLGEA